MELVEVHSVPTCSECFLVLALFGEAIGHLRDILDGRNWLLVVSSSFLLPDVQWCELYALTAMNWAASLCLPCHNEFGS